MKFVFIRVKIPKIITANVIVGVSLVVVLCFLFSGDTTKGEVVRYASRQAELCSKDASSGGESSTTDPDEALLWKLLVLLCQQNGVSDASCISNLYIYKHHVCVCVRVRV